MDQPPSGTVTFVAVHAESLASLSSVSGAFLDRLAPLAEKGAWIPPYSSGDLNAVFSFRSMADAIEGVCASAGKPEESLQAISLFGGYALHVAEVADNQHLVEQASRALRMAAYPRAWQAVLSASAFEVYRDSLQNDLQVRDIGTVLPEGQLRRERLYQLFGGALTAAHTIVPAEEKRLPQLPAGYGFLLGRDSELDEILGLLESRRFVTVTGLAGIGKTHVAVQAVRSAEDSFADGIFWVDLEGAKSEDQLIERFWRSFGIAGSTTINFGRYIAGQVRNRELLIVLDGCDAARSHLAGCIESLLAVEGPSILATAVRKLGFPGEEVVPLKGLQLPPSGHEVTREALEQADATALFLDELNEVCPERALTSEEQKAIRDLCKELQGHPMAIKIAAKRFAEKGSGVLLRSYARASSLETSISWTYDALSERAKVILKAVAALKDPWQIETAARMAEEEREVARGAVRELRSVGLVESAGNRLYRTMPRIARLVLDGICRQEEAVEIRERHALLFLGQLIEHAKELWGPRQEEHLDHLDSIRSDLSEAFEWLLSSGRHPSEFTDAMIRSWSYWYIRNRLDEALKLIQAAVKTAPHKDHADVGRLLNLSSSLFTKKGATEQAIRAAEKSVSIARAHSHRLLEAAALSNLAFALWAEVLPARADRHYSEALTVVREIGATDHLPSLLIARIPCLLEVGKTEEAARSLDEACQHMRSTDPFTAWTAHLGTGQIAYSKGLLSVARDAFMASLRSAEEAGDSAACARSVIWLAEASSASGDFVHAAQLLGLAISLADHAGIVLYKSNRLRMERLEGRLLDQLKHRDVTVYKLEGSMISTTQLV